MAHTTRAGKPPKLPKGYKPAHTTYKVVTETSYEKPYKAPPKAVRGKVKPYIQPVRVVNPKAFRGKGKGK